MNMLMITNMASGGKYSTWCKILYCAHVKNCVENFAIFDVNNIRYVDSENNFDI